MPIDTNIIDIKSKKSAKIATNRSISVNILQPDVPGKGQKNVFRYFSALLGVDGADKGSTSQNVNGSVTPKKFFVGADPDSDIHIMGVLIAVADQPVAHSKFGNLTALTNGWDLLIEESGLETKLINKAKTGGQIIIQAGAYWPYGDLAGAWELSNFTGTSDATMVNFPISEFVPGGVRLGRGTFDKIEAIVNDDLTGLDDMFVRIYGFRHFPFVEARSRA